MREILQAWAAGCPDSRKAKQHDDEHLSICLEKLLKADAQARLFTYRNKFTFNGVEYAPLMYKIIMPLATIDSVATMQTLGHNPQSFGVNVATVSGNIDKVHSEFDKNYSQLIASGATIDNPIGNLFKAYLVVPCHNFKTYVHWQNEDYLDGKLTAITHKALI
jgi:hypothetical protein